MSGDATPAHDSEQPECDPSLGGVRWDPDDASAEVLVDACFHAPPDVVAEAVFGPFPGSDVQEAFHRDSGHADVCVSEWRRCDAGRLDGGGPPTPTSLGVRAWREVRFVAQGYPAREVQQELERSDSDTREYLQRVTTEATYGDSFASLVSTTVEGLPGGRSRVLVRSCVKFTRAVNAIVRAFVLKAANGGMREAHAVLERLLRAKWPEKQVEVEVEVKEVVVEEKPRKSAVETVAAEVCQPPAGEVPPLLVRVREGGILKDAAALSGILWAALAATAALVAAVAGVCVAAWGLLTPSGARWGAWDVLRQLAAVAADARASGKVAPVSEEHRRAAEPLLAHSDLPGPLRQAALATLLALADMVLGSSSLASRALGVAGQAAHALRDWPIAASAPLGAPRTLAQWVWGLSAGAVLGALGDRLWAMSASSDDLAALNAPGGRRKRRVLFRDLGFREDSRERQGKGVSDQRGGGPAGPHARSAPTRGASPDTTSAEGSASETSALASGSEQSDSEKNPVFSMSHRVCVYPLVPTSEAGEGQAAVLAPVGVPIAAPRVSAKSDDGQGPTGDAPTLRAYEVFENERRQPFRGFGHSWPGHLLPTDPARYSARCGADPGPNAHRLSSLELRLPPGWQWRGRWRVDVAPSQWAEPGCDKHGWSYWLDFPRAQWPPPPGRGARTAGTFVRVRRWVRVTERTGQGDEGAGASADVGADAGVDAEGALHAAHSVSETALAEMKGGAGEATVAAGAE